ncbi:MAG: hypothetical protein WDN26_11090 [Chitinophagaceae bacterium]
MFNLFGKKSGKIKIADIIWTSEEAKWNGIVEEWKKYPSLQIVCWFESTQQVLEERFAREITSNNFIYTVHHAHASQLKGKPLIFAEHYPLLKKEEELFGQWQLEKVTIHSALSEPLFLHFGGEKILQMMRQMGMREEESIKNELISKAISGAQEKIEKKVTTEMLAHSQKDWLEKNLT